MNTTVYVVGWIAPKDDFEYVESTAYKNKDSAVRRVALLRSNDLLKDYKFHVLTCEVKEREEL